MIAVVLDVTGSGKTTFAALLATRLGLPFREVDAPHAPATLENLRGGAPLTDAGRLPWIPRIAREIDVFSALTARHSESSARGPA